MRRYLRNGRRCLPHLDHNMTMAMLKVCYRYRLYKHQWTEVTGWAGKSRIHLNIERWRVCEAWFSPNMAGVDSAGLGEIMQNVLSRFSDQEKGRLVKVSTNTFPAPLLHLKVLVRMCSSPEVHHSFRSSFRGCRRCCGLFSLPQCR